MHDVQDGEESYFSVDLDKILDDGYLYFPPRFHFVVLVWQQTVQVVCYWVLLCFLCIQRRRCLYVKLYSPLLNLCPNVYMYTAMNSIVRCPLWCISFCILCEIFDAYHFVIYIYENNQNSIIPLFILSVIQAQYKGFVNLHSVYGLTIVCHFDGCTEVMIFVHLHMCVCVFQPTNRKMPDQ